MKKHIGFISLDSSLVSWLCQALRTSAPQTDSAQDLLEGFRDLLEGSADSLMVELGDGELPVPPSDAICCGDLSISSIFWPATGTKCLPKSRSTRRCGKAITCWTTATSWPLSENCARK